MHFPSPPLAEIRRGFLISQSHDYCSPQIWLFFFVLGFAFLPLTRLETYYINQLTSKHPPHLHLYRHRFPTADKAHQLSPGPWKLHYRPITAQLDPVYLTRRPDWCVMALPCCRTPPGIRREGGWRRREGNNILELPVPKKFKCVGRPRFYSWL